MRHISVCPHSLYITIESRLLAERVSGDQCRRVEATALPARTPFEPLSAKARSRVADAAIIKELMETDNEPKDVIVTMSGAMLRTATSFAGATSPLLALALSCQSRMSFGNMGRSAGVNSSYS
jgi:hypothetical protein